MTDQDLRHKADAVMMHTYKRFPIVLVKGKGCVVWDINGRSYRDFIAGIAVCNLGHAHPAVCDALRKQAETLWHVSNLYYTAPQIALADWLTRHSFAARVFFCNSGAEANEAAIKLCRKFFYDRGEKRRFRIISMNQSFHGRTMAALSATGQDKIKQGFDPVLGGFDFVPFGDLDALRQKLGSSTAAVLLEPVQGEGGVCIPPPGYLEAVRDICDDTGTLLVFDEIQTGMGRTGKLFAYEHFGIEPDVMTLAKALGNGLPIGATLAREEIASAFSPGAHATTFGGTPIVTAAALAVVETMAAENMVAHCEQVGSYFKRKLRELQARHAVIDDVRGMGLLIGMALKIKGDVVVKACLAKGFLVNCIQESILRFAPPLIVQESDIDALLACLDEVFTQVSGSSQTTKS